MRKKVLLFLYLLYGIIFAKFFILNNNPIIVYDEVSYTVTAPRGRILDTNGIVLVDNIGIHSLIYNNLNNTEKDRIEISKTLSEILDITSNVDDYNLKYYYYINNKSLVDKRVSSDKLKAYEERKISSETLFNSKLDLITNEELLSINPKEAYIFYLINKGYKDDDKLIKKDLTNEEYTSINKLNIKGLRTDLTWERYYPYGNTLRDVFGLVSSFNQGIPLELKEEYLSKGYNLNDRVGISNLEYIYDDYLKGEKGTYKIINNRIITTKEPIKGHDIVLSIDINLTKQIEEILEKEMILAKNGINTKYYNQSYVIVSDPNDGSIISLIGKKINPDKTFTDYSYYNIKSSFTIGSAVKGASISVGYKYNLINDTKKIKDGCVILKNQKPKCSWADLGYVDSKEALRMSSNYYQYLIAISLTGNKYKSNIKINATNNHFEIYREMFKSYGLGNYTGIDLTGEETGIKGTNQSDDLLLNMAIGQYDTYTPISLSQYINTIATGTRNKITLLKYVLNNDGTIYYQNSKEVLNEVPINNEDLNKIREGFRAVNATGTGYSYTNHKFSSAGKTGTSESFIDTNNDGVVDTKTVSTSYVTYFPYEEPKYSIVIVSPNIKYSTNSSYKYPINARVIKNISNLIINND